MHTLYWAPDTAAFAPQAVMEELGVAYRTQTVDLERGEHRSPEYLALNPAGYVPTLVTDTEQVLYESAAIVLYLCDRHPEGGLIPEPGEPARGDFYRALFYLTNTVQEAYKRHYYAERYSSDAGDAPRVKAKADLDLAERWDIVEAGLAARGPHLLGERLSAADIYLTMLASWYDPPDALLERCPRVRECVAKVAERPGVRRAMGMHPDMQGMI